MAYSVTFRKDDIYEAEAIHTQIQTAYNNNRMKLKHSISNLYVNSSLHI